LEALQKPSKVAFLLA